jgi:hypothetical protein
MLLAFLSVAEANEVICLVVPVYSYRLFVIQVFISSERSVL